MVFRSKVDLWLAAVVLLAAATSTLGAVVVLRQASAVALALVLSIVALGTVLPLWVLASTRYVLRGNTLHIRSGPFSWHIPAASIASIDPTRSPISSPALSLNRLRISYGAGRSVLVSPVDHAAFISALSKAKNAA